MGTRADHQEKADHDREFLKSIDAKRFPDWVVVAAFHRALHLVEMLFAKHNRHSVNHWDRHDALKREFQDLWRAYRPLYALARHARYRVRSISPQSKDHALNRLARVEELVSELIAK